MKQGAGLLLAVAALAIILAGRALAEGRVALVIGNAAYIHGGLLSNPSHDAAAVAQALTRAGFTVTTRTDLGRDALVDALKAFARDSADADTALVYFSGHGMEIGGVNYLIPIDATLAADTDINFEAVPLDLVVTSVDRARRLKVVILDACRNNPYLDTMKRSNGAKAINVGLAAPEVGAGMLIAYAAREGDTAADGAGANSPYAEALAQRLPESGVDVRLLFGEVRDDVMAATRGRQEPRTYFSIGGGALYLNPPTGAALATSSPGGEGAFELRYWDTVDRGDPAQLKAYLEQYPSGRFSGLARAKLASLRPDVAAPSASGAADPTSGGGWIGLTIADLSTDLAAVIDAPGLAGALVAATQADGPAARGGLVQGDIVTAIDGRPVAKAQDLIAITRAAPVGGFLAVDRYRNGVKDTLRLEVARRPTAEQIAAFGTAGAETLAKGEAARKAGDFGESMRWYRQAADQGNANAMVGIGVLYFSGLGVARDYAEAMRWYAAAAAKGIPAGAFALGTMYDDANGVPQDYVAARRWYALAAATGNSGAQERIGYLYHFGRGVPRDYERALYWYRLAAAHNDVSAQTNIGALYVSGLGVKRDFAEGMRWYSLAAAQGGVTAERDIGFLYANGLGVPRDKAQARQWLSKAAAQGDQTARRWLEQNP